MSKPGNNIPPASPQSDTLKGSLVMQDFEYDGGRRVTVYVPPSLPEVVVFSGDGQVISRWGQNLESGGGPSTMIVGAHRTESDDEEGRLGEYSPALDPSRFAAHEHFFVHDVHEWVRSQFGPLPPPRYNVVAGVSASAEFALAMALRHPGLYSAVFAASPGGGYIPPKVMPRATPRAYLTAGTLEPFFLENAFRWAEALHAAGADVVMREQVGDHGDPFWQIEFNKFVDWILE